MPKIARLGERQTHNFAIKTSTKNCQILESAHKTEKIKLKSKFYFRLRNLISN